MVLPADVAEHTASQYARAYDGMETGGKPDPEWAAMLRKLDKYDPDYKG